MDFLQKFFKIRNCIFRRNKGLQGGVLYMNDINLFFLNDYLLEIKNTLFESNYA